MVRRRVKDCRKPVDGGGNIRRGIRSGKPDRQWTLLADDDDDESWWGTSLRQIRYYIQTSRLCCYNNMSPSCFHGWAWNSVLYEARVRTLYMCFLVSDYFWLFLRKRINCNHVSLLKSSRKLGTTLKVSFKLWISNKKYYLFIFLRLMKSRLSRYWSSPNLLYLPTHKVIRVGKY